jgi:crotonobetainyl-CoA:carnitine CoA-transferase CaiB-like acyl-CoA transferase
MGKAKKTAGLLDGLRVIEIGQRIAGPVVGMVLAEQGAEVIRIVDRCQPTADPLLDALLARGKNELSLDLSTETDRQVLRQLVKQADVVLENRQLGTMERLGIDFDAIRAETNPRLISCSIPGFAPGDPRETLPDYEPIIGAAGYLYTKPIGVPWVHDFPLGSVLAGLFAASGVAAALIARLRTGKGQHVRSSIFHSDIFAQVVLVLMKTGIPRGFLPLKMIGTPFMGSWLCGDGRYIYLHISLPAHNARILEVLDEHGHGEQVARLREVLSEETMRDPSQVKSIPEAQKIKEIYEEIFLARPAQQWEEILGGELCVIKVRTIDEWLPDTMEAGMADASVVDDPIFGELMASGAAVTVEETPPHLVARTIDADAGELVTRWNRKRRGAKAHAPPSRRELEPDLKHPLQGMRVVDLARVIAGPCAARILAELGAEVTSIQSPSRLDWALSFHLLFNTGKKSVTLDFTDEEGKAKLWALMEEIQPHAFIQNYRHIQLAETIGVHPAALRERFPNIAYTHLNAYGNLGIWRNRPGFEQVVQAVSGIQMTYGRGGKPKLLPTPVIDIGSGLLGSFATLLGLYQQLRKDESVFCTTHLTRMAVLFQLGPIADYQRARCMEAAKQAGHDVQYDPSRQVIGGILRARDGFFCLAGPRADVQRWLDSTGLGEAAPEGANPLEYVSRKAWLRSMDHWERSISKHGLAGTLVTVPVPSMGKMLEEIPELDPSNPPIVRKREFSGVHDHPLTFIRNPIELSATPTADVSPAPMRGQDSVEVLARIGVEAAEDCVIPYPEAKPLPVYISTLVRWGYFAWRSGNI